MGNRENKHKWRDIVAAKRHQQQYPISNNYCFLHQSVVIIDILMLITASRMIHPFIYQLSRSTVLPLSIMIRQRSQLRQFSSTAESRRWWVLLPGQCLWHSWQSGHFRHQRACVRTQPSMMLIATFWNDPSIHSSIRIQPSTIIVTSIYLFTATCRKDKI